MREIREIRENEINEKMENAKEIRMGANKKWKRKFDGKKKKEKKKGRK